jgi:hypothetical protein
MDFWLVILYKYHVQIMDTKSTVGEMVTLQIDTQA